MIVVDYEGIARKVVNICMGIKKGEVIFVQGGVHNFELVEDIAVNIRKVGAFPVVTVSTDRLRKRITEEVDIEYLKMTPEHIVKWLDEVSGYINVDSSVDPRTLMALDEAKVGAQEAALQPVQNKFIERGIRWTGMGYPTPEKAQMYNVPYEEFHDMFWRAVDVDYEALRRRGWRIAQLLNGARRVELTSAKGTKLTFSLEGRQPVVDDGIISDEDIALGFVGNNLPCGEVFVAPVEDSAEGRAVFDLAFYRGHRIADIDLTFEGGQVTKMAAAENEEVFRERIKNATGGKDVIGEFGIGINPEVHRAVGYTITDEKIIGSIHIALGENRHFGGKNESSLHWDLVMMHPTVIADGTILMEEGKLLAG
jgi:aminopeptidase